EHTTLIELAETGKAPFDAAVGYLLRGYDRSREAKLDLALADAQEALRRSRALRDIDGEAGALQLTGQVEYKRGHLDDAMKAFEAALRTRKGSPTILGSI